MCVSVCVCVCVCVAHSSNTVLPSLHNESSLVMLHFASPFAPTALAACMRASCSSFVFWMQVLEVSADILGGYKCPHTTPHSPIMYEKPRGPDFYFNELLSHDLCVFEFCSLSAVVLRTYVITAIKPTLTASPA